MTLLAAGCIVYRDIPRTMSGICFEIKGNIKLLQQSVYPPKPHWTPDQLPDLSGRVMLVTGASA